MLISKKLLACAFLCAAAATPAFAFFAHDPHVPGAIQTLRSWDAVCALSPEGEVICTGTNSRGSLGIGSNDSNDDEWKQFKPKFPDGVSIAQIAAGQIDNFCALTREGEIYCWGNMYTGSEYGADTLKPELYRLPDNEVAVEISGNDSLYCARTQSLNLYCWGHNGYYAGNFGPGTYVEGRDMYNEQMKSVGFTPGQYPVKVALSNIKYIDVNYYYACFLDTNDKSTCFGTAEHPYHSSRPPSNAQVIANYKKSLETRSNAMVPIGRFQMNALEDSLKGLAKITYRHKAAFFMKASGAIGALPKVGTELNFKNMELLKARLFAINAIKPVMENLSSEQLSERVIPSYFASLKDVNEKNSITSLADLGMEPSTAKVSVQLFEAALSSSQAFLSDKSEVAQMQAALGQALASPLRRADLRKLTQVLSAHRHRLEALSQNNRTRGLGLMMLSLLEAME